MTDKVEVDPAKLKSASTQMAGVGKQVQQIVDDLKAAIAGKGEPWGNDSYGSEFSKNYVPGRDALITGGGNMATSVNSYADGMSKASDNFRNSEQTSADQYR